MDLRQIKTFVHVADLKSFTRAASFLRISQPALSRQMRLFEEELGKKLFHRHGHGISLTNDGVLLLERCTALLNEFENIRMDFSSREKLSMVTGTVGIGIPVPASRLIGDLIESEHTAAVPGISLRIVEGFSALIHEWLISGSIDLAILYGPRISKVVDREILAIEQQQAIMTATEENRARKSISLAELASAPLIVPHKPHIIRDMLEIRGLHPKILEIDAITIMVALARAGKGSTILPLTAVQDAVDAGHVVAVPIEGEFTWEVSICYSNLRPLSEAAQVAVRLIREEVRRLIESGKWASATLPTPEAPLNMVSM